MKLYVRTTTDEYELPVAVADSARELAKMLGTTENVVQSSISHHYPGWFRIEISLDEYWPTPEGLLWTYLPNGRVVYFE